MKGKQQTDIYSVKLAVTQLPKLTIDYSRNIVKYGVKNDFPAYLLFLYKNHPLHGGIVNGKARYLSGKGIKAKQETVNSEAFLDRANAKESWYQLKKKLDKDEVLSGGFFLLVRTNAIGMPLEYHHLSFAKCRISPCQSIISYSEDWNKLYEYPAVQFPLWRKGIVGDSVYVYKNYSPNKTLLEGTYPDPEYVSCVIDIDTDIRIGSFSNSLVKNNFSAGNIITVRNGEADKAKQKTISESLSFNFEGEENAGKSVVIFGNKDTGSTDVQSINTNDQDKQYVEVNKRDQQNILTSHGVNAALFKVITEGNGLNTTSELAFAQEQFLSEYVKVKQESTLEIIENFYELRYNEEIEFEIEQVDPIGLDLPLENQNVVTALNSVDPNLIPNYLIKKYNLQKSLAVNSQGLPVAQAQANNNLKGLSGRENQDMKRIVREYNNQSLTLDQAILRLVFYGMTEEEAKKYLGANDNLPGAEPVQQSAVDKSKVFFELFNKYAHDINEDDEIIDVQECHHAIKFSKENNNAVLEQIKGDPTVKPEDIAKSTNIPLDEVKKSIKELIALGLIAAGLKAFEITEKALNKDTEQSEVYTEYVYDLRSDVSYAGRDNRIGDKLLQSSHEFCKEMVLKYGKKAISYEGIIQLTNDFGENAWDYRGGFTGKGNGKVDPFCNHIWKAVTKIRRKK